MSSENLDIPDLTEGQSGKVTSINAAVNAMDKAITNRESIAVSGASTDLTAAQTTQNKGYIFTGALSATHTVYLDANEKFFWARDATTGDHEVRVRITGDVGAYVVLPKGANEYAVLYCDGTTDVIKIQVSGAAAGTDEAAYMSAYLSGDQASPADTEEIEFVTVEESNVITVSSGEFTLPGGERTFMLVGNVAASFSGTTGEVTVQWYDITGTAYIGKPQTIRANTHATHEARAGQCIAFFQGGTGTNDVELRVKGTPTALSNILAAGTYAYISQVSSMSNVVGITEVITAHVAALTENDVIVLDEYAMYDYDVELVRIKLNTGTLDADFKIGVTSITGLSAVAVTSTQSQATASAANSVTVGDRLTVTLTNLAGSPDHLTFTLKITRQS